MKIFVAGATGVIGRRIIPLLVEGGHDVVGMSRSAERARSLEDYGVRGVVADVYDTERLRRLLADEKPEIVIHELTDIPHELEPGHTIEQFAANRRMRIEGTRNLVEAARDAGARRIVAQSYAHVYEWLPFYARLVGAPPPRHIPAVAERVLRHEHLAFRSTMQRGAANAKARARLGFAPAWVSWRDGLRSELERAAVA